MTKMNNGSIGISPEYVKGWSLEEAIREIIQNYLDVRNELEVDGSISYNEEKGQAIIKDFGPGMEMRHLVMGISEKSEDAIGQFGEGLKLALLVFAREGRKIEIWTNGKKIRPVIEYNDYYETELINLTAEEMEPHFKANHTGTSIKFDCSENELETGKSYFIDFYKRDEDEFEWFVKEDDFQVSLPGGNIFVNGSRVGEIENAKFSYHFSGKDARKAINRDRGSIDTEKLDEVLCDRIYEMRSLKFMKALFEIAHTDESSECWEWHLDLRPFRFDNKNKALWKRAATSVFGKNAVIADQQVTQAKYKGYNIVQLYRWRWKNVLNVVCEIPFTQEALKSERTSTKKVAQKDLTDEELSNYRTARKLIEKNYAKVGRVEIVEYFNNDTDADITGMYKSDKDVIQLRRDRLNSLVKTVQTLLHEVVHKETGHSDCSPEFESALCRIAAQTMIKNN